MKAREKKKKKELKGMEQLDCPWTSFRDVMTVP